MTKRKRAKLPDAWPTYAWAAVDKRSGKILIDLSDHYSIWTTRKWAEFDCPAYGRVARVRIVEVKPRPQRERTR